MSAVAGWYPDPGGRPGLFRWWDGRTWSATTTAHPASTPPPGVSPGPAARMQPAATPVLTPARRRAPVGAVLAVVAGVVVIAVLAVLAVRLLGGSAPDPEPPTSPSTGTSAPEAQCPPERTSSDVPNRAPESGGRVTSGKLSYPEVGDPFRAPITDDRVPFGADVRTQNALVEDPPGGPPWAAGVTIATLTAGDGFYGPEQGAKLVARCIVGTFYGNYEVARKDSISKATTVDGYSGWLIESTLSYDIPDINAKTELLLVLVIDTRDGNAGLFYGSVPDSAPELVAPTRRALSELRVG